MDSLLVSPRTTRADKLRSAFVCLATVVGMFAAQPAASQAIVECEATFVLYNKQPALNRLWFTVTNDGTFFDPADLVGYRERRPVRLEWLCSPFDQPCRGDSAPFRQADYRFSDGVDRLLTSSTPGGLPEPVLEISVSRPATDPGTFDIAVTKAIDPYGEDVLPMPLVCLERVSCAGTSLGAVHAVPLNCGDPTGDGRVTVADALAALFDVIELPAMGCQGALHVCDTDNTGAIELSDALRLLKIAIELDFALDCPLPSGCG